MKTLTKLLLLLVCAAYLAFVFLKVSRTETITKCESVRTLVADSAKAGFITPAEVERILQQHALYPVGREMGKISGAEIEKALERNNFIRKAHVYKTPANRAVNIIISQRTPLMRVMTKSDDFYVDENGQRMQAGRYAADVPVVTGSADLRYVRRKLLPLGRLLRDDDFWNAQIQQLCVEPDGEIDLVPRVGSQLIHFGDPAQQAEVKLRNLRAFYEKVMPEVGWNKYRQINLEHTNQIICKK
ncbi:MAG: cell division protein [Prevotellaceae bacterium]|nr:cell division protein [Prevotellaceae bacterium]